MEFIAFISFCVCILGYNYYLNYAYRKQYCQYEREEGPQSHKKKNHTITMGGIVFVTVTNLIFLILMLVRRENVIIKFLFLTIPFFGFGIIGYIDDYLKIFKRNNLGLRPNLKLLLQVIVAGICFFLFLDLKLSTAIQIFGYELELGFVYGLFLLFVLVSYSNAVNISDGVDGLCSGLAIIYLFAFSIIAYQKNEKFIMIFILILIASLACFLFFNFNKSLLFMGDTGSLALGGIVGVIGIMLKEELLMFIIGLPFFIEILSVVLQVSYFKMTKGKRIFKMAPFHHHLELSGFSEKKIVLLFYVFGLFCAVTGLLIGGYL